MTNYAEKLNEELKNSVISSLLSDYGKRIFLPKGIIVQGAEAKGKEFNATIGIGMMHKKPLCLKSVKQYFNNISDSELFPYSPGLGNPELRKAWDEEEEEKNPSLKGKTRSLPAVTAGLTHALYLISRLFINKNDAVVMPDMYWENYDLIFTENSGAKMKTFPMFKNDVFNTAALEETINKVKSEKVVVLLNFPNNPTGYTPSEKEQQEIVKVLKRAAKTKKLLVISDDAYYSLFFEENTARESLFASLCDADKNILAIKCDAATKEEMVWGFRIGFITFAHKGITSSEIDAMSQKLAGAIRGTVSNCSTPAQNILLKAMKDEEYKKNKEEGVEIIKQRYFTMKNALTKYKNDTRLTPLPFNSGYFMSFKVNNEDAESLRQRLLNEYSLGAIALQGKYLRLAFSSLDNEDIEEVIDRVYKAAV